MSTPTTTCTGCAAVLVATTSTIGGVELPVPVGHDVRDGALWGAPCPGAGWPGIPAPDAPAAEWAARTQALAAEVLALRLLDEWNAPGVPPLTAAERSYGVVPEISVLDGTAAPVSVTLTGDGRAVFTGEWCACKASELAVDAVYFERWTAAGRAAHGWACVGCRKVCQTG